MSVAEFESSIAEDRGEPAADAPVLTAIGLAAIVEDALVPVTVVSAEEQWEHLVGAHADSLWRFAIKLGLAEPAAEAVCELAWLRLAQRWSPIGGHSDEQVREWLEETVCWESRAYRRRAPEVRRPRLRLVPSPR